jgi:hypothetical protein
MTSICRDPDSCARGLKERDAAVRVLRQDRPVSQPGVASCTWVQAYRSEHERRASNQPGRRGCRPEAQTPRFYERPDLLREPSRTAGGHRIYPPETGIAVLQPASVPAASRRNENRHGIGGFFYASR